MKQLVNLAYYKENDWERFIASIDDKESMHDTWKEWYSAFLKTKMDLISQGFIVNEFVVEIDKLQDYCKKRGIKNDGKARSRFVANK